MRRSVKILLGAVLLVVVAFGAVTFLALEGREVVVLRTTDEAGRARETRTWIADADGALWVEAANEARPFLEDLRARPALVLQRGGASYYCVAAPSSNPEGHRRIRRLLAEKYGWADRWIGVVADTSGSVAVRLNCEAAAARSAARG